jgi:opacity protein-like surface antigen
VPAATATNTTERSSNTLVLGLEAKVTDQLSISASIEGGKANDNGKKIDQASRFELGISYQVAERTRLYAKVDSQRGLASQYSLEPSAKSQSLSLGIDSTYMQGGNVFSEYRLRDSIGGQESQIASGLRNAWQISEGILLSTGAERLKLLAGTGQNATALTAGVDFTHSELWKAGGRIEWRRLDGVTTSLGGANPGISQQDTLLFTLNASQKIARDWTILARNYYLATNNRGAVANGWQDRFQLGAAYRPVDNNALDVLSKLEYKTETNINGQNESRQALIAAVQANYHPSRAWWLSARLAAKYVNERFPINQGGNSDKYKAYLIGGRLIYDLTENIDLGLNLGLMSGKGSSQAGVSLQKGIGLEVGYRFATNLWGTLGYNIAGYSDKDLSSDYTSKGVYLKLRYKFDQDLFESNNPAVNNLLEPRQVKP